MIVKEAIRVLRKSAFLSKDLSWQAIDEATDMAIEALEKQAPKKFLWDDGNPICPVCGEEVWDMEWCNNCGQRLDREEEVK